MGLLVLMLVAQVHLELTAPADAESIVIERLEAGSWRKVAELRCAPTCDWQPPDAAAYRAKAVDAAGNRSSPVPVAPTCAWRFGKVAVEVACSGDCDCEAAVGRLEDAARWLLGYQLATDEELQRTVPGLRVLVSRRRWFTMPKGEEAEGFYSAGAHVMVVGADGSAAMHELLHAVEARTEREVGTDGHDSWRESPHVTAIDGAFRERYRGRSLWSRRSP